MSSVEKGLTEDIGSEVESFTLYLGRVVKWRWTVRDSLSSVKFVHLREAVRDSRTGDDKRVGTFRCGMIHELRH